jgi:hypothetical protein
MMKSLPLLAFLLFGLTAFAECYYTDYQLTFNISTAKEERVCYQTISSCDFNLDSINSVEYLKGVFSMSGNTDCIKVYKYQQPFAYCLEGKTECPENEKDIIYALFEEIILDKSEVSDFKVIETISVSALESISTELELADTLLFRQDPIEVISCEAYLCYHTISIYEENPDIKTVLDDIKALTSEVAQLGDEMDYRNEDDYDDRLWQLIDQLKTADGVITVSGCSD